MALKPQIFAFFHPDLGIGGAERLVIDAAVGLQNRGHKIVIFTSHCDPAHCFEEARDGTLDVRVRGNSIIPRSIFGRLAIICAILRQLHLIIQISIFGRELSDLKPKVLFVDQLSAGIPLLRLVIPNARILFYCHFPDKLLVQSRTNPIKRLYRIPFDSLESWSTGCADSIVVNSSFTQSIFAAAFPSLSHRRPAVVYPCVPAESLDSDDHLSDSPPLWRSKRIILSINRFERKKGLDLAVRAFARLPASIRRTTRLVLAGGYDTRVVENVQHHAELNSLATSLGLNPATAKTVIAALAIPDDVDVLFLLSVPSKFKDTLLDSATLLVYTPPGEHFGIVPLEAMRAGVPVLAADKGGPTETVIDGVTGWLRNVDEVEAWTRVMQSALEKTPDDSDLKEMGRRGKERVERNFSAGKMARRLEEAVSEMARTRRQAMDASGFVVIVLGVVGGIIAVVGVGSALWSYGATQSSQS